MTRWDIPPVSLGKSCAFVVGVLFGLWPRSFVLLRCFLSMAKRKSGGGICVSSFGFGAFCCACVIRFANFLMRPLCFMLSFSIRLLAYPNVRTEPQSDIGHNRGKKSESRNSSVVRPWKFEQNILGQALRQALRQASRASRHGNWNKTI